MTEEVGKGRVLTEVIGVVGIVEWRLNITGQEYQTLANATAQLAAACYVCLFAEHNILFLVFYLFSEFREFREFSDDATK
jgi:hypothetical protein